MTSSRELIDLIQDAIDGVTTVELEIVLVKVTGERLRLDESRKWVASRSGNTIGIDPPHASGMVHGHIYARRGGAEIGTVNIDGTGSHGTKMRLTKHDAEALRGQGFNIRDDRLVEWMALDDLSVHLLFG